MALPYNDPYGGGETLLNRGDSRITATATSPMSASGVVAQYNSAMSNAAALTRAMAGFTNTVSQAERKQQDITNAAYRQAVAAGDDVRKFRDENPTGGVWGAMARMFGGTNGPTPLVRLQGENTMGLRAGTQALLQSPDYANIMRTYANDPDSATKRKEAVLALGKKLEAAYIAKNPNASEASLRGFRSSILSASDKASEGALKEYMKTLSDAGRANANYDASTLSVPRQYRIMAESAVRAVVGAGGDFSGTAAKLFQFTQMENPKWNPDAVSPTGVRGFTQTTKARFDEIKQRMLKDGRTDLYAMMKDRSDSQSSFLALAYELPRMEAKAKSILGRTPKTSEIYLLWNLGDGGGTNVLKDIAAGKGGQHVYDLYKNYDVNTRNAILNNHNLYAGKSINEVLSEINNRMKLQNPYYRKAQHISSMKSGVIFTETSGIPEGTTRWNYQWKDFKNSGVAGGKGFLDSRVVQALDQVSTFLNRKVGVTSAQRGVDYNKKAGGVSGSQHIHGNALDIAITNPKEQRETIKFLSSIGIKGIGVYKGWIHFDLAKNRSWIGTGDKAPSITKEELIKLKAEGAKYASAGNYYRRSGFNGNPPSSLHTEAYNLARKHGISVKDARGILIKNTINNALTTARTGNPQDSVNLLSGFIQSYAGGLTPEDHTTLIQAQSTAVNIALQARRLQEAADKASNRKAWEAGATELANEPDPTKRLALAQKAAERFSKTKDGSSMKAAFMNLAIAPPAGAEMLTETFIAQHGAKKDLWKIIGFEKKPENVDEAMDMALKNPNIVGKYGFKGSLKIIKHSFAMDRTPFAFDKNGTQPVLETSWKNGMSQMLMPITTKFLNLTGNSLPATLQAQKLMLQNRITNQSQLPWAGLVKNFYFDRVNALAERHRTAFGKYPEQQEMSNLFETANKQAYEYAKSISDEIINSYMKGGDPITTLSALKLSASERIQKVAQHFGKLTEQGAVDFVTIENKLGVPIETFNIDQLSSLFPKNSYVAKADAKDGTMLVNFPDPTTGRYKQIILRPTTYEMDKFENELVRQPPETAAAVPQRMKPAQAAAAAAKQPAPSAQPEGKPRIEISEPQKRVPKVDVPALLNQAGVPALLNQAGQALSQGGQAISKFLDNTKVNTAQQAEQEFSRWYQKTFRRSKEGKKMSKLRKTDYGAWLKDFEALRQYYMKNLYKPK